MKTTINRHVGMGFFLLALFFSNPSFSQNKIQLTLQESIQYALENNVDAKNAQLETMAAKALVVERRAEGLPQITANMDFTYNAIIPLVFVPSEGGFIPPDPNNPPQSDVIGVRLGTNYSSVLAVQLNQMIFDGSYFVGLKAASTYKMLTEYDREKSENDVKESIKKAYFTVLVNDERRKIVEANLQRLDSLLKETEILYNAGFAEKIDVSRIKVQRNNIKTELDKVLTAEVISVELLKLQMGLPLEYEITLTETLQQLNPQDEIQELLNFQGTRRVEVDQIKTNIDLINLDLRNNTSQYMPRLGFFGTYQRNAAAQTTGAIWESNRWVSGSFIGLNLSIPIFDGLTKSAKIQQNRVQIQQLENQKYFIEENIEIEKFQSRTNLQNSLQALRVQDENRELAMEVFRMTKIKYEEGVGSNFEVVEADSALKEAESNYFSALYDALIAKVDLEKALGIL
ncbi:Outer membrane protein TolC [Aquiflexum balticum DSM 16537]|uniref:Outer membrane protein TolC n=1 Tax=Aquiflexum balticum DSM 16537 TaxID=758820 RepID=A0A1W2H9X1_9BACT|nr:TolC family protein [Aquiflexum balticum]SMD45695.1 Outer membrane protein TolC [Aquiflexum balticum DSM 16537]